MTFQKSLCAVCITAIFVGGCATPSGGGSDSDGTNTALRCALFGLGGAVIGGVVAGQDGAVKGAIAGLAACAVIEIASRQTRSAAEVEQQYKVTNRNQLPPNAKIDSYTTSVSPHGAAKAGDTITVDSNIRVVSGTNEPVSDVKEVLIAYAPSGEEFKRGEKKVNEVTGSGEYTNSFKLKLPKGAPQGIYKLQTQVYVNNKLNSTRESKLQVASVDSKIVVAALDR